MQCCVPVIQELGGLRQEDHELKAVLGYRPIWGTEQLKANLRYMVRTYLKYKGWGCDSVVELPTSYT